MFQIKLIIFSLKREPSFNKNNNMAALASYWQLPDSIKSIIFEYDNTYKLKMKDEVFVNLWRTKWIHWRNGLDCIYSKVVMDHLFNMWGVWENSPYGEPCNIYWFKKHYFPDSFRIVTDYNSIRGVSVKVFSQYSCVFEGWVLNQSEQTDMVWLDNREVMNTIDIHWDVENGLFVWQKLYG